MPVQLINKYVEIICEKYSPDEIKKNPDKLNHERADFGIHFDTLDTLEFALDQFLRWGYRIMDGKIHCPFCFGKEFVRQNAKRLSWDRYYDNNSNEITLDEYLKLNPIEA